jgi:hypothetical protein
MKVGPFLEGSIFSCSGSMFLTIADISLAIPAKSRGLVSLRLLSSKQSSASPNFLIAFLVIRSLRLLIKFLFGVLS